MKTVYVSLGAIFVTWLLLISGCGDSYPTSPRETPIPASIVQIVGTRWFTGCVELGGGNSMQERLEIRVGGRFEVLTEQYRGRNCVTLEGKSRIQGTITDVPSQTFSNLAVDLTVTYAEAADFTAGAARPGVFVEYRAPITAERLDGKVSRNVLRVEGTRLYLDSVGLAFAADPTRSHTLDRLRPYAQLP